MQRKMNGSKKKNKKKNSPLERLQHYNKILMFKDIPS